MNEQDVLNEAALLGDKSFAQCSGDALRRVLSKLSSNDSGIVTGLVIDFGLKQTIEMLESAQRFVEATEV